MHENNLSYVDVTVVILESQDNPVISPVRLPGHGAVDDMLDAENKILAENLSSKVSRLKSVRHI